MKTFYRNIKGLTYRYRENTDGYDIDIKLNDAFAQLQGHETLGDLLSDDNGTPYENLMRKYGCIPDYLPMQVNGKDSDIMTQAKAIQAYYEWAKKL